VLYHFKVNCVVSDFFKRVYIFSRGMVCKLQKSIVLTNDIFEKKRTRIKIIKKVFTVFQYPHLIEATTWIYFVTIWHNQYLSRFARFLWNKTLSATINDAGFSMIAVMLKFKFYWLSIYDIGCQLF